jgi:hypothetical protein
VITSTTPAIRATHDADRAWFCENNTTAASSPRPARHKRTAQPAAPIGGRPSAPLPRRWRGIRTSQTPTWQNQAPFGPRPSPGAADPPATRTSNAQITLFGHSTDSQAHDQLAAHIGGKARVIPDHRCHLQ